MDYLSNNKDKSPVDCMQGRWKFLWSTTTLFFNTYSIASPCAKQPTTCDASGQP